MAKKVENGMTMIEMSKLILQGTLKNVYLFYGPENFLKTFFTSKIIERAGGSKDSAIRLEGKVKSGDLEDALDSSPLFSEQTIVIVRNSGAFKAAIKGDYDYSFLPEISEDSFCIFLEEEVDKRNVNYKIVESCGTVLECGELSEADVIMVLTKRVGGYNRKIDVSAVNLLYNGVGRDLNTLVNEVDKLSLLVSEGGTINEAIVRAGSELSVEAKTYDFTDAVASKNAEKALSCLNAMIADKLPEQIILSAIAKHFTTLYTVAGLAEEKYTNKEIAEKLRIFEFLAAKYIKQSRNYSKTTIADIVNYISDIDYRAKNGLVDIGVGLELIIQYICG